MSYLTTANLDEITSAIAPMKDSDACGVDIYLEVLLIILIMNSSNKLIMNSSDNDKLIMNSSDKLIMNSSDNDKLIMNSSDKLIMNLSDNDKLIMNSSDKLIMNLSDNDKLTQINKFILELAINW